MLAPCTVQGFPEVSHKSCETLATLGDPQIFDFFKLAQNAPKLLDSAAATLAMVDEMTAAAWGLLGATENTLASPVPLEEYTQ
jgi:hypothetical protein